MSGKLVIYETRGRAKEFCPLAINLFSGCGHRCTYCYGPDVIRRNRQDWYDRPVPRLSTQEIQRSAKLWQRKVEVENYLTNDVLLCFVTDPYQPIEEDLKLTRQTIEILHNHGFTVTILTKAGPLARRDFDLLGPADTFATTLTFTCSFDQRKWEPRAGSPRERMRNLEVAHSMGIPTWVSLEPVISTYQTLWIIERAAAITGHFKVGTLNYHPAGKTIDWPTFGHEALEILERLGAQYYIKKGLAKHLGYNEGFWGGPE